MNYDFTVTRDRYNERNDSDTSYTKKPKRKVKWRIKKKYSGGRLKNRPPPDKTKKYIVPYKGIVCLSRDRWQVSP